MESVAKLGLLYYGYFKITIRVFHSERDSWSGNLELIFDIFEVPVLQIIHLAATLGRLINTCDNDLSERSQSR